MTRELQPDVVLMDIRMRELDGIEATRRIFADNSVAPPPGFDELTPRELEVYRLLAAGNSNTRSEPHSVCVLSPPQVGLLRFERHQAVNLTG